VTRVLALTALEIEAERLARHLSLDRVAGADWPCYRGGAIEIVAVGLRARWIAERVVADRDRRPVLAVSAGACGALDPGLQRGDLVVPEAVTAPTTGVRHPTDPVPGLARRGALLTVAEVTQTAADKARLWMQTGALAVDMESSPIVEWARARGLPVAVIRAVSDTAAQAVPADLAALVDSRGRVRAGQALRAALARPGAVADALALGRGADIALRAVAAALATIARGNPHA
jgi:hypothetical protein